MDIIQYLKLKKHCETLYIVVKIWHEKICECEFAISYSRNEAVESVANYLPKLLFHEYLYNTSTLY